MPSSVAFLMVTMKPSTTKGQQEINACEKGGWFF